MKRSAVKRCLALALAGGLAAWAVTPASGADGAGASDPCGETYSVAWRDWTSLTPEELTRGDAAGREAVAAWQVLGERFVDHWIESDADGTYRTMAIGVWNLVPGEVPLLTGRLAAAGVNGIELRHRAYSRAQVNDLVAKVEGAMRTAGGWASFGPHHYAGAVAVTYRAECLAAAAEAIQAATGQAPLQGADAAAFYAGATSALTYANSWTPPPAPVVLLTPGLAVTPLHGAIFVAPGGTDGAGFSTSSVSRSGVTDAGKRAAPKVGAKTRVTAKVAKAKIGRGTRATVKVTVKVPGSAKPTGKVAVSWGSRTKAVTLKASAKGKVTVKLPRLSRGTYRLTVRYVDSAGKATSSSKAVRLTVA